MQRKRNDQPNGPNENKSALVFLYMILLSYLRSITTITTIITLLYVTAAAAAGCQHNIVRYLVSRGR